MSAVGRLDGKVALITGTAGGMGRAAAELFAREGARVVGCNMKAEGAEETVRRVREAGGEMVSAAPVDLADEHAARAWVDEAAAAFGGVDVLFDNASSTRTGPCVELTAGDWHYVIRTVRERTLEAGTAAGATRTLRSARTGENGAVEVDGEVALALVRAALAAMETRP